MNMLNSDYYSSNIYINSFIIRLDIETDKPLKYIKIEYLNKLLNDFTYDFNAGGSCFFYLINGTNRLKFEINLIFHINNKYFVDYGDDLEFLNSFAEYINHILYFHDEETETIFPDIIAKLYLLK
jgi:hypothetical protein